MNDRLKRLAEAEAASLRLVYSRTPAARKLSHLMSDGECVLAVWRAAHEPAVPMPPSPFSPAEERDALEEWRSLRRYAGEDPAA